ncbi:hypothetical protein G3A43_08550 [Paraburkholderia aspalathi]|nr:hypothetical protein [Paraburkholderia aspalathi]MBK3780306.1 hypothetical protein [Paraburkholderia aspalathi]
MYIRKCFPLLALGTLMHVSADAYAQAGAAPDSSTTVVTLYSEARPAPGTPASDATAQRPPIQIVNGGVKSAGDSCWKLSETGEVITQPGDCYVLRSAKPGETPPAR